MLISPIARRICITYSLLERKMFPPARLFSGTSITILVCSRPTQGWHMMTVRSSIGLSRKLMEGKLSCWKKSF